MNLVECREACLRNCSCVAYARTEVSGCVAWFGGLLDVRDYSEGGQDLYIKMAASDLGKTLPSLLETISRLICSSTCMLEPVVQKKGIEMQCHAVLTNVSFSFNAWRVWNEGKPLELIDALMESPAPTAEVLKCIQTGLLCVQQRPEDRPTMSFVLLALDSGNPMLPQPKQPGFYTERDLSTATDTLTSIQSINENGTLVSPRGKFQLGFFSPGSSKKRYVGIWYNNIPNQTIVWVANRENPLNDTSGVLKIGSDGNLLLLDGTEQVVWSTKIQNISSVTTALQLLDSGNLVLKGESGTKVENFLWQSFDHPCDTLLPGMKLGWDLETRLNRNLTSWKSADDPSPGEYTFGLELQGLPQLVQRKGSVKQLRSGAWDRVQFRGLMITPNPAFISKVIVNLKVAYYEFDLYNESTLVMMVLNYSGTQQPLVWNSIRLEWLSMPGLHRDQCDDYANCGPNSICNTSDPRVCSCLTGYVPKSSQDWDMLIWYGGCIRENPLNCLKGEGFIELTGMKTPDLLQFWMKASMSLEECRLECLKNCTCTAYASASGAGSGCLLWFGDLIDIRKLKEYGNQKLYIRAAAMDQEENSTGFGYMSPEYAIDGIYSVKSDVFSFGVLVLEIVSGKRNREFHYPEHDFNLLGHAWKLWTEEKAFQLVDPQMEDSFPMPELLDSGNLVLREEGAASVGSFIWQSFDHPTDSQLSGMKLGWDLTIGLNRNLTAWKSENDPSRGDYSYNLDVNGLPQLVLRKGLDKQFRTGFWDGMEFNGLGISPKLAFAPKVVTGSKEVYYAFDLFNDSTLTMSALSYSGALQRLIWDKITLEWVVQVALPRDQCDNYGKCGSNAICTINDPRICSCLAGYVPTSAQEWDLLIWSGGCVRKVPLGCPAGEGFIALERVKKPDLLQYWINPSMTLQECEVECLKNCSCTAYANSNVTGGGSGCLLWFEDLVDIRKLDEAANNKLYIRVPASDLPPISEPKKKKNVVVVPVAVAASIAAVLLIVSFSIWKCRLGKEDSAGSRPFSQHRDEEKLELPVLDIITISEATNNFSFSNKIGEGGFGPVYKAWKLWTEEKALEIVDPVMEHSFSVPEVVRCIKVALLCVQQSPEDRPTMSMVVSMLDSESTILQQPKQPGFFAEGSASQTEVSSSGTELITNSLTNTLEARFGRITVVDSGKLAWKLWTEGKALELVDPIIEHSFSVPEVLRCIQVGLLCVQQNPGDRPTMSTVVLMLDSDSEVLQQPKQPGFVAESSASETEISSSRREFLAKKLTSTLEAR
ncbi:hypothetical protein RJ639_042724 [Escallonia herrerae]|uniref:Uncharacterized protein n=1 Tax=Escallonia herrerae TaxID=1293975 RepID=A0AA89B035_9ASTE|nr:hypothetical protein RJ639_042724 [Escallonia herrerae]